MLWWRMPAGSDTLITGSGNMNQWLFVLPSKDLVIAVTGADNSASVPDFVYRDVLTAIVRD